MSTTASASHAYLGAEFFSVVAPLPPLPEGPVFWMLLVILYHFEMPQTGRYRPECTPLHFFGAISLAIVGP